MNRKGAYFERSQEGESPMSSIEDIQKTYEKALDLPPLKGASSAQVAFANNRRIAAARRLIREARRGSSTYLNFKVNFEDCASLQRLLNTRLPRMYSTTRASDWLDTDLRRVGDYEYFDDLQPFQKFMLEINPPRSKGSDFVSKYLNL